MATGHAKLKSALVLRDALADDLGLPLDQIMGNLNNLEDTLGASRALHEGRYLNSMEALCTGDVSHLAVADQKVRGACLKLGLAPRYAQYLALVFFAHWISCKKRDEAAFLQRLNVYLEDWLKDTKKERINNFTPNDIQFVAFWMATGSGKTHVLHACLAMMREAEKWDRTILVTPSESLSIQHAKKLRECKEWDVFAYPNDGDAYALGRLPTDTVIVIDINKLSETKRGDGVTIATSAFQDGRNLVFVDEGHKGQKTEESKWKKLQQDLAGIGSSQAKHRGILIEFSATFGQVIEAEKTLSQYAKSIILDYAYDRFHGDLYGKDFWNIKLDSKAEASGDVRSNTLTAALISYWYQLSCFANSKVQRQIQKEGVDISKPLWLLLGLSVIGSKSSIADREQTSDVIAVLKYLNDILSVPANLEKLVRAVLDSGRAGSSLLSELVEAALVGRAPESISASILTDVFGRQQGDIPGFRVLKTAQGELGLGLQRGDAIHYYGVVNVGDVSGLKKAVEESGLQVGRDAFAPSLFGDLEQENSTVNLLIGSRRFAEGWDNYRASSLTLLRLGQHEGSLIIQMFGRVIRFAGRNMDGKRIPEAVGSLAALQTAFVYGLRSKYLETFLSGLFDNGIGSKLRIECDTELYLPSPTSLKSIQTVPPDRHDFSVQLSGASWASKVNKIVVSYAASISTSGIDDAGLQSQSAQLGIDVTSQFKDRLNLLNIDKVYLALLAWKKASQVWNFSFDRSSVVAALEQGNYEVHALPTFLEIHGPRDIDRLNEAATTIVRKIFESAFRKAESANSTYTMVSALDSGIPQSYFKETTNGG